MRWRTSLAKGPFNFVSGALCEPAAATHKFDNFQPATGTTLCSVPASGAADVNAAVAAAKAAWPKWAAAHPRRRADVLRDTARLIRENLDDIARWETNDNGKPIIEARWDVEGVADLFDFFAGVALTLPGEQYNLGTSDNQFAWGVRESLGVCAGIGAWNYPFQTVSWKCAPALAMGNTLVYKPSPWSPLTALVLAQLLVEAGAPEGIFSVVQGEGDTGAALCSHPDVAKVSFTGSVPTGRLVQAAASKGPKPVTLELGGKSPVIVFGDCDLDMAVNGALLANFLTQGEVCNNGTRVFVHRSIVDEFAKKLVAKTKSIKVGDPLDEGTTMGALITEQHLDNVLSYVQVARDEGAKVLCGGERLNNIKSGGYFMSPAVISDVTDNMRVAREEIFGPVLSLLVFDDETEVLQRANDTQFGLAAAVFTRDLGVAHRCASRLQAGVVYVNTYNTYDPGVPFGGFKRSGFGRECGLNAVNSYTQLKSVWVNAAGSLDSHF